MKYNILLISPPVAPAVPAPGTSEGKLAKKAFAKQKLGALPPLGLLYLASELLEAGQNVEVVDFNARNYSQELLSNLLHNKDIVGLSVFSFNRKEVDMVIADIKTLSPHTKIIVGGPDITLYPRVIDKADAAIIGEAEDRIVGVVEALVNGHTLEQYKGVLVRNNGKVTGNPECQIQMDLDKVKFPARHILKEKYSLWGEKLANKVTTIVTTRGCPFSCKFCAHNRITYKHRARGVKNVLDEIELIYQQGYEILGIVDETFTISRKRMVQIAEGIIERKIKLLLAIEGRVAPADDELYKLLRKAGTRLLYFGIESGNQEVLNFYRKGVTVEQNRNAIELANKNSIFSVGSFILGAPIETKKHFDRTIKFACKTPLDFGNFFVLEYTYGSELWDEAYASGKVKADEFDVPADSARGLGQFTKQKLETACTRAFYRFYIRPKWWIRELQKLIAERDKRIVRLFFHIVKVAIAQLTA
ncbi:MAG: radical SAM protein [Candidatus Stahlbacteria bacterium]|nr:radical SAM protein [Candidatus Stahlbacteria bacterium]